MLGELRLRASPWLTLTFGILWIVYQLGAKRGALVFGDVYPGISLLAASALLFWVVRWVDRPIQIPKKRDPFAVLPPIIDERFQADGKLPPTQMDSDQPS